MTRPAQLMTLPSVPDDNLVTTRLLITSWIPATGRTLRADVPQQLLTKEPITFWADKQAAVGRITAIRPASRKDAR